MPIVLKGKKDNIELKVPGCSGGGGSGAVVSVNGQTGIVVLDIPSKVSELENDAGYLTEHQSLDALATKEALNDGLAAKQDKLTAGANITIENNVISASGSGIGGTSNHAELSNLDFAHSGHTGFASTEDIPTKLSQLENDSEFITSASIPTKVSQLENDRNYATTSQIPTKVSQLDNDESYLTSTTADAQGYVKEAELDKKQDKLTAGSGIVISDNNTITATTTYTLPIAGQGKLGGVALYGHKDETDVYNNDFAINQSNGIIEMRRAEKIISRPDTMDQAPYANYVRDFHLGGVKLKPTSLLTVDDDGYIDVYTAGLKSEIVPTNVGAFTNDAGYITEEAIPTVPTKVSELENDSNFITNSDIPTNVSYFTNDAGYLTEHQNLDAYATKTELATGLAEKQATLTAGANITIENNVISASASGGEPDAYIKSASVSGNTLTLTNKDDTTVAFTPSGGSSLPVPQSNFQLLYYKNNSVQWENLTSIFINYGLDIVALSNLGWKVETPTNSVFYNTKELAFIIKNTEDVYASFYYNFRYFDDVWNETTLGQSWSNKYFYCQVGNSSGLWYYNGSEFVFPEVLQPILVAYKD